MKSVLLVINTMTYFTGLVEVGRFLKKSGYSPIFYFPHAYPKYENDVAVCENEGMRYICAFEKINGSIRDSSRLTPRQEIVKKLLLAVYRNFFVGFVYEMMNYAKAFSRIRRVVKDIHPSLLAVAGDNIGHNTDIFIKVCRENTIPSVIIPLFTTGPVEAAEAYFYNPAHDGKRMSNRILAYFEPKWLYVHKGKRLLRWPAFKILAMKIFGLVPPLPWVVNSSFADLILTECREVKAFMVREGIPSSQITVTGSLANDIMADNIENFESRRRDLCKKLRLDEKKPILLCALPPNILYGYSRPVCDFRTYSDLVDFWMKSVSQVKNHNIVISLHPAIKYDEIRYIEEYGVKIALEKATDLIPFCDLFVAAMSGTIYWATACSKPVLNYDVYKYRYSDFEKFPGIVYTERMDEFQNLLRKFTEDSAYHSRIEAMQKASSGEWGMLDGKCGERILACIDALIKKYSA